MEALIPSPEFNRLRSKRFSRSGEGAISKADWSKEAESLSLLYGNGDAAGNDDDDSSDDSKSNDVESTPLLSKKKKKKKKKKNDTSNDDGNAKDSSSTNIVAEIPAIIVAILINFMTAIPFGVAYFPLGWSNDNDAGTAGGDDVNDGKISGPFPLPGKEILGIRMFLFAIITGQIALNLVSKFGSSVSVQLIENVPFYHAMAAIVIAEQGYGKEALSTLFFLFGFSSVVTGSMFYGLGKAGLGRVAYYFPGHVLVGLIGGIGVFILNSSTGVTTGEDFTFTREGVTHLANHFDKFAPAVVFEILLRLLMVVHRNKDGSPKSLLLTPLFFISIIPMYYVALFVGGVSLEDATNFGAFFPSADGGGVGSSGAGAGGPSSFWSKAFDGHLLDIFRVIDVGTISWTAVSKSIPTVIGVSIFSVVNVPINIPAFANTCNVDDVDMNNELIAHGYSNILTGIFGGIQNVMTYSVSVLYYKSGGRSRAASWLLLVGYLFMFVFGVMVMPYIPRCLASTLLLHIGIDLTLEGLYDSYNEYDRIEYTGILAIVGVMTSFGMTPALAAGVVVAMTTYAVQNITYVDPIFTITTAETLRSSAWTRPSDAMAVLDSSDTGRSRIMVIQLQGNVFFGNVVDMADAIKSRLAEMEPIVVIIDFTLVVAMDSSAAQSINKLKNAMDRVYGVKTNIFVMGNHRGYFPCEYGLSTAILGEGGGGGGGDNDHASQKMPKNQLCVGFDEALVFAEDILIARVDPSLVEKHDAKSDPKHSHETKQTELTPDEERELALHYVESLIRLGRCSTTTNTNDDGVVLRDNAEAFLSYMKREEYDPNEYVWKTGDKSDSAKLVVSGNLVASTTKNDANANNTNANSSSSTAGTTTTTTMMRRGYFEEEIPRGVMIGELGLIDGVNRLSCVKCAPSSSSQKVVLFSLDKGSWERMVSEDPAVARILDHVCIRYLSHRVQHVSNRLIETRCLPV